MLVSPQDYIRIIKAIDQQEGSCEIKPELLMRAEMTVLQWVINPRTDCPQNKEILVNAIAMLARDLQLYFNTQLGDHPQIHEAHKLTYNYLLINGMINRAPNIGSGSCTCL